MRIGVRILLASALAAGLLAGPALAQFKNDKPENPLLEQEEKHRKDNAEIDKKYDAMRRQTEAKSDKPAKVDPWANMRSSADNPKK